MILLVALFVSLFLLLITAAYTDLASGKVYNWTTYPGIGIGLALNFLIGGIGGDLSNGPAAANYNLVNSAAGCILGFLVLGVFHVSGGMGAGDMKLGAAIGAMIGWQYLVWSLFYTSLVGGVMALSVAIWRGRLQQSLKGALRFGVTLRPPLLVDGQKPLTIPFGLALVVGTYWCWFMFILDVKFFPFPLLAGHS